MKKIVMVLVIVACSLQLVCGAELVFYSYHDKAPYYGHVSGEGDALVTGIYSDFVQFLNARQEVYRIRIEFLPRVRLDQKLERGTLRGAVIGVNPVWFRDRERTKYLWSAPFMHDEDVIIVRQGNTFPYEHPRDLVGKQLTLPRGLYWWGVTELIRDGKIQAEETEQDLQNLEKVALGRSDATITSVLSFKHLMRVHFPGGGLEALPTPHDRFERMLLFPRDQEEALRVLSPLLDSALDDPAWIKELEKYGYEIRMP